MVAAKAHTSDCMQIADVILRNCEYCGAAPAPPSFGSVDRQDSAVLMYKMPCGAGVPVLQLHEVCHVG